MKGTQDWEGGGNMKRGVNMVGSKQGGSKQDIYF